jgi:hypothetical protein
MAVPKNYNQTDRRVESLNDLTFYTVNYEYELTNMDNFTVEQIDVVLREVNGVKEFSALDDETAESKINEWLDSLKIQEILKEYDVVDITSQSFYDKLVDKKLSDILELGNIIK